MKRLVVIPAYNEAQMIERVVSGVKSQLPGATVLVVNDGSTDATAMRARAAGARVISHLINRGLGGAIGTGLAYAKKNGYQFMVTFDADGQHDPKDLPLAFANLQQKQADVLIGTRINRGNKIPWDRKWLNWLANGLTLLLYGVITNDSQSGFRGFSKNAIDQIKIKTERMEVSSEIFGEIARLKLKLLEMPIKVRYTKYSRDKGQGNANAVEIFWRLMIRLFR